MGKKSPNKENENQKVSGTKISRKAKRSARKTCGVLALIMAVVIATIPTPSSQAVGGVEGDQSDPGISYPTEPALENDSNIPEIPKTSGTGNYEALMIYQTSAGEYELWKIYDFYLTTISGSQTGVISKYNDVFVPQGGTLTLTSAVITSYPNFSLDAIDAFFDNATTGDVLLTDKELEQYYPDEWQQYLDDLASYNEEWAKYQSDYDAYQEALSQWNSNGGIGEAPVPPAQPTTSLPVKPSHQAKELTKSSRNRRDYFLHHSPNLTNLPGDGEGYTLVEVIDKTADTGAGGASRTIVYIPFNPDEVQNGDVASGFWTSTLNRYDVRYIGERAFEGATSITKIVIPDEIRQIGDYAFADASGLQEVTAYSGTIGNRAFKNCASLQTVTIGNGTLIGTECFYGCNRLRTISFPSTITKIGAGAFAYCSSLQDIDMSEINTNVTIDRFAFYACYALNNVKFADFTQEIGDAAFAVAEIAPTGSWRDVVFPDNVGTLGTYVLAGRTNLRSVTMPANYGASSEVTLGEGFFKGCINLEYVEFPDNGNGSCGLVKFPTNAFIDVLSEDFYVRGPELDSRNNVASPRSSAWAAGITYVYKDKNGVDRWEKGSGIYRFTVDDNGILTSCVLISNDVQDQFSGEPNNGEVVIPAKIGELTVTGIGPDCFDVNTDRYIYENLRTLRIEDGSQIKSIDSSAFEGMPALETVYIGNSINSIGNRAFANCSKLTQVVFSTPQNGYSGFTIGTDAFATGGDKLTFFGDIVEGYAPFTWAMNPDNYMNAAEQRRVCYRSGTPEAPNLMVILNNDTNEVTLIDYPHYDELSEEIRTKYEKFLAGNYTSNDEIAMSAEESTQLNNVLMIDIPAGIQSIDVKAYIASTNNSNNVATYLVSDRYYTTYRNYGLFNGYYGTESGGTREYPDDTAGNQKEEVDKGNDRILSVTMHTVRSLPDRAFESCENLQSVILGSALTDIGTAPFTGCKNLVSVGGNDTYTCTNGIIYENNANGKTIIECLPARGRGVGSSNLDYTSDPNLAEVTEIADGAFENCANIISIDLSSATGLQRIPKDCFKGDSNLVTVVLPDSVNEINSGAFVNTREYLTVTIPSKEVAIATEAFDAMAILRSYEGSAVETYAYMNGHQFQPINENWLVVFLLSTDGTEIARQYVEDGRAALEPELPEIPGYTFDRWSQTFTNITHDTIVVAVYLPNSQFVSPTPSTKPTSPTPTPTTSPDATTTPAPSVSPGAQNLAAQYQLTVLNGSCRVMYAAGTTVIITANTPPSGQTFRNWTSASNDFNITASTLSVTTITMPAHDLTITANFGSSSDSTNGSGSGNGSGNGTNGSGNGPDNASDRVGNSETTVDITKPGISNTDLATATVDGSTDNFIVKITDTAEARAAVEAALRREYGSLDNLSYFAMDISLYDETGTYKIEDTTGLAVNITMPIPDDLITYAGNNRVASVINGDVLEHLGTRFTTINGVPCVTFTATHFSPYTIYVDRTSLSVGVSDSTPKTGDMVHPKWFLVIGLVCTSMILLLKKDKKRQPRVTPA